MDFLKSKLNIANINNFCSLVICFPAAFGFTIMMSAFGGAVRSSVLSLLLIVPLFYLARRVLTEFNRRTFVFSLSMSFLCAIVFILGEQFEKQAYLNWTIGTLVKLLLSSSFFYILIYNLLLSFNHLPENTPFVEIKFIKWKVFSIIFLFELIGFLALYPGVYGYDSGYQIAEFLVPGFDLSSHWSILHSFILAKIVELGYSVFKSYEIGFSIYIFLQMLFLCYAATRVCLFTYRSTRKKLFLVLSVLFFSFHQTSIIMSLSAAQDSVFSGLFTLIILESLILIKNPCIFFNRKQNIIKFGFLIILLCMIRNNGFYLLIIIIPFFVVLLKKYRFHILTCFLVPIICFQIYQGPIFEILHINQGNSLREMSSIPCQQLFRVYCNNPGILSEEEKKEFEIFFNVTDVEYDIFVYNYNASISDYMKGKLNTDLVKSEPMRFAKLYFSVGYKDPKNYIEAFMMQTLALWYPDKAYPDHRMYHPYIEQKNTPHLYNEKYLVIERDSFIPIYNTALEKFAEGEWSKIPFASVVFAPGFYFLLLLFTVAVSIYKKNFIMLIPLSLFIGLYLTVFLGPVALFRYVYPVIFSAPLLIAILYEKSHELYNDERGND